MTGCRCNISLIIVLALLLSVQAFSQQINFSDSLSEYNTPKAYLKPILHYSVGSTFMFVPHVGSVTGFTLSPSFSVPLSQKWSVDGGIIAGRYYSTFRNLNKEGIMPGVFNALSIYGAASYHVNPQLTLYGIGTKQLTNTSPFYSIPKSSYALGSTYKFGDFSIGVAFQVSKWNNIRSPFPFDGSQGFNSPYDQGLGLMQGFGR
jgi:long-subunit fatty acid transport protein